MIKRIFRTTALSLALLMTLSVCGAFLEGRALERSLLRLHIRGCGGIRIDELGARLSDRLETMLADVADLDGAKTWIGANLPRIESWVRRELGRAEVAVRAALTRKAAPREDDGARSLPAGDYDALEITLGDGAGESIWSVAFPDLCAGVERCAANNRAVLCLMDLFGRIKGLIWKE